MKITFYAIQKHSEENHWIPHLSLPCLPIYWLLKSLDSENPLQSCHWGPSHWPQEQGQPVAPARSRYLDAPAWYFPEVSRERKAEEKGDSTYPRKQGTRNEAAGHVSDDFFWHPSSTPTRSGSCKVMACRRGSNHTWVPWSFVWNPKELPWSALWMIQSVVCGPTASASPAACQKCTVRGCWLRVHIVPRYPDDFIGQKGLGSTLLWAALRTKLGVSQVNSSVHVGSQGLASSTSIQNVFVDPKLSLFLRWYYRGKMC